MDIVWQEVAVVAGIAFLGAFVFGITGFGSALFTIPLSSFVVPLPVALALFSVLDMLNALRVGLEDPKSAVRREWTRLVPAILVGTVAGVTLLVNLPRRTLMFALATFIVSMGVSGLVRGAAVRTVSAGWAWVAGFCGGVTSTVFGAGGPPYAIYLSRRNLENVQYRATLGRCAIVSIGARLVAFTATGILLQPKVWLMAAAVFPASWLGITVSTKLFKRMSRELLMRIVAVGLLATGASLFVRACNLAG